MKHIFGIRTTHSSSTDTKPPPSSLLRPFTVQALIVKGGSSSVSSRSSSTISTPSSSSSYSTDTASATNQNKIKCKEYARIGLLDFSASHQYFNEVNDDDNDKDEQNVMPVQIPRGNGIELSKKSSSSTYHQLVTSTILNQLLQQWIRKGMTLMTKDNKSESKSTNNNDYENHIIEFGTIYAIPSTEHMQLQDEPKLTKGKFVITSTTGSGVVVDDMNIIESKDIGDIVETIGCLVDSIIILYDVNFKHRHSAIVRLMKGVQRQIRSMKRLEKRGEQRNLSGSNISDNNNDSGSNVNLIFLANSKKGALELGAIKDILVEENDISDEYIHIINISNNDEEGGADGYDDINLDERVVKVAEEVMNYLHMHDANDDEIITNSPVTIDAYSKLLSNVYLRFSGKKSAEKKDVQLIFNTVGIEQDSYDDIDQDALGDVSLDFYPIEEKTSVNEEKGEEIVDDDVLSAYEEEINDNLEDVLNLDNDEEEKGLDDSSSSQYEDDISDNQEGVINLEDYDVDEIDSSLSQCEEDSSDNEEEISDDEIESSNNNTINTSLTDILVMKSHDIMQEAEELMRILETKQNEVLLDLDTKMPVLSFGSEANDILTIVLRCFDGEDFDDFDSEIIENKRNEMFMKVNDQILLLFETQIYHLREYYGRRYEAVLNSLDEQMNANPNELDDTELNEYREKRNTLLKEAAERSTEGFKIAAENAIPSILQDNEWKDTCSRYEFRSVLDGLIRDILQSTAAVQNEEEEWTNINTISAYEDSDLTNNATRVIRWYEKLAARALVLGVNYLQGWLAWQGIKRAAAQRDKMMPKFPMF